MRSCLFSMQMRFPDVQLVRQRQTVLLPATGSRRVVRNRRADSLTDLPFFLEKDSGSHAVSADLNFQADPATGVHQNNEYFAVDRTNTKKSEHARAASANISREGRPTLAGRETTCRPLCAT